MSTRWSLVVADETDRTVRQAIFWETLESVWERNEHLSTEEVQVLDDAVAQDRADRARHERLRERVGPR